MRKRIFMVLMVVVIALCVLLLAGVAYAEEGKVPDTEIWVEFASSLMATLVVVLPVVSVILVKIAKIMKKSAEVTGEYQRVQLAIAEAAADGDVDNKELANIVAKGQSAGVQTKELYEMIKDMIAQAHRNIKRKETK